mmetsp:Transcript_27081/g.66776  ORF Transcript_27081/g.66776 Transcript_27081/m.66776 type:complete len:205 (+) Transcript_27081:1139-1753(+)
MDHLVEVCPELLLRLELYDRLSHVHVCLDDDGQQEVLHKQEADAEVEHHEGLKVPSVLPCLGKLAKEHDEFCLHGCLERLEVVPMASEAPRADSSEAAHKHKDEKSSMPQVVGSIRQRSSEQRQARVHRRALNHSEQRDEENDNTEVVALCLCPNECKELVDRFEEFFLLVLQRNFNALPGNVVEVSQDPASLRCTLHLLREAH